MFPDLFTESFILLSDTDSDLLEFPLEKLSSSSELDKESDESEGLVGANFDLCLLLKLSSSSLLTILLWDLYLLLLSFLDLSLMS